MSEPSPGDVSRLLDIMARLRDPQGGCPWDLEQDFASIAVYTIEEAYEVADAIDRRDMAHLKDELGDLLLQVVFHSQMASEEGSFTFDGVVDAICDKMIRRHPHVFAGASVANAQQQTQQWEAQKRSEREAARGSDRSAMAGISRGLPEWQRATKLQARAARVGFDWPDPAPVIAKLHEEIEEVRAEFARGDVADNHQRLQDEIGDVLFVCTNLARHAGVDVGAALRQANSKFERRFREMEAQAAADGTTLEALSLDRQEAYWDQAKRRERGQG